MNGIEIEEPDVRQAAIFLDRDGVLIENRANYVRSWQDVAIYPWTMPVMRRLSQSIYKVILITNQSAVGRGIISLQQAEAINQRLAAEIERNGGRVDAVYMCPHAPADGCQCRKPEPGMLHRAAGELSIDLARSYLIGDALTDLGAGHAAGVKHNLLLLTGRGRQQLQLPDAGEMAPFSVAEDLGQAVSMLFEGRLPAL